MPKHKIQSLRSLRDEMKSVARGERPAPRDAAKPSFNSIEALIRVLTKENRELLATIRKCKPQSITELSEISGRAQSNLTRTLTKLEAAGLIRMEATSSRTKAPRAIVTKIVVEIDPYSNSDHLKVA